MLRAGFAREDITPSDAVPLGGYFTLRPRLSKKILDRLYVRAISLSQDDLQVVVLVYNILIITPELSARVREAVAELGAKALLVATHTHSGPGEYWAPRAATMSMGPFRKAVLDRLVTAGVDAARAALEDQAPATTAVHTARLPDTAVNRRDESLDPDDLLWALRLEREDKTALLCGFPAHPVIVAERDLYAISADFPGRVVSMLEEQVDFAAFVNGPLGGAGTHFPEQEMTANENLDLAARPLADAALRCLQLPRQDDVRLSFSSRAFSVPDVPNPRAAFDDQTIGRLITWPLEALARWLFSDTDIDEGLVQAVAVGDAVLVGTPADLGYNVARAIRGLAEAKGLTSPFVASQADGYIGYVQRRSDYEKRPGTGTLPMALYENVMGVFGDQMGEQLVEEVGKLLDGLRTPTKSDELVAS